MNNKKNGIVFDIKRFATDDGPGVRGLIFLKGCPLKCKWCANPESQNPEPEIIYYKNKCRGCGKCIETCTEDAIKPDIRFGLMTDSNKCLACGKCSEACFYGAREIMGKKMHVIEIMNIIRRDKSYYDNTGGGVTLTGGEPLFQYQFTGEILKACKSDRIHTAIETCGYANWESYKDILPYLNLIFYDIKHIDFVKHCQYTGVNNNLIIENLKKLNKYFLGEIIVRIPLIPEHNNDKKTLKGIFEFLDSLENINKIEIMPYHRLGINKYYGLGREYELEELKPVDKNKLGYIKEIADIYNIKINF